MVSLCKDADSERIRQNVLEVYLDMFEIFQAAVKVFTKSSGTEFLVPLQIAHTPRYTKANCISMNTRNQENACRSRCAPLEAFRYQIQPSDPENECPQRNIEAEVRIWKLKRDDQTYTETMIWRKYISQELKDTKEEFRVLSEEKRFTALEKEADLESRKEILVILRELQAEKRRLEGRRLGKYPCRTIPYTSSWHV